MEWFATVLTESGPDAVLWMIAGSWLTLLFDRWRLGDPVAKRIREAIREMGSDNGKA